MRRISLGFFCVLMACGGGVAPEPTQAATETDAGIDAPPATPQTASITQVDVMQVTQVTVMKDGVRVDVRNAPIIANRSAVVRVAVKPDVGWKRKKIDAVLTVTNAAGSIDRKKTIEIGPNGSIIGALDTTFNFELEKELVTKDLTWSVVVKNGEEELGRFPQEGADALEAAPSAALKVKLVPVKWTADGSGRIPDVGPDMLDVYKRTMLSMYPVTDIDITVHEPYEWKEAVTPDGDGWDTLLDAIVDLRNAESAASDVYYYAVFNPNDSFWKYCREGCVAGLSHLVGNPTDAFMRGSIGLGYSGDESAGTMAHEIGHAHGRPHAPCGGAAGIDRKFPYTDGSIGVYGWDDVEKSLIDPTFSDIMGYCHPKFISDYTYKALYTRIAYVSKPKSIVTLSDAPIRYRFINVDRAGHLKWGRTTITRNTPFSDPTTITFEAADGSKQSITGFYYPHDLGGTIVVPEPTIPAVKLTADKLPAGIDKVLTIR
jgi:hypothetical protein